MRRDWRKYLTEEEAAILDLHGELIFYHMGRCAAVIEEVCAREGIDNPIARPIPMATEMIRAMGMAAN